MKSGGQQGKLEVLSVKILIYIYSIMSVVTFAAYGHDKRRAIQGRWRIKEQNLHLLELCFGWPGAVVAQLVFRHKLRKFEYMAIFVGIVVVHIGAIAAFYHLSH